MSFANVTIAASILGSALITGFFWGWGVSAIPGLAKVSDRTYVSSMQSINKAILNPMFLIVFVGSVFLLVLAVIVAFANGDTRRGWWLTAAAVAYTVGVVGLTMVGNVPLNDQLEAFDSTGGTDADFAAARRDYEGPWNRLHYIRSTVGVFAVVFASVAALAGTED